MAVDQINIVVKIIKGDSLPLTAGWLSPFILYKGDEYENEVDCFRDYSRRSFSALEI